MSSDGTQIFCPSSFATGASASASATPTSAQAYGSATIYERPVPAGEASAGSFAGFADMIAITGGSGSGMLEGFYDFVVPLSPPIIFEVPVVPLTMNVSVSQAGQTASCNNQFVCPPFPPTPLPLPPITGVAVGVVSSFTYGVPFSVIGNVSVGANQEAGREFPCNPPICGLGGSGSVTLLGFASLNSDGTLGPLLPFAIIPEPVSWAEISIGLGLLFVFQRKTLRK
jgi:hypothetical protein